MKKIKKTATGENTEQKSVRSSKPSVSWVDARNQELESMLKRTLADYQNLERRIEEERKQLSKLTALLLIEKLLPVLDNLESANNHIKDQGLEIVIKQFKDVLFQEGVEEIEADGQQFDPNLHEAVEIQEGDKDNKIVKVVTKGYKIEDKVIRPTKVVVVKKSAHKNPEPNQMEEAKEVSDYA